MPTPSGLLAPSYAPPTFSFSASKPVSFNAASIANALANRPPEPLQFPQEHIENEFDAVDPEWRQWSCRDVRLKIRAFLGSRKMTQAAFLKVIDVDASLYRRFMALKGPDEGGSNPTYKGAAIFFYRREQQEKKEEAMKPKETKRTAAEVNQAKQRLKVKPKEKKRKTAGEREEKAKKARDGKELLRRVEDVELPDVDEEGCVPVYDDCDEIRRKIDEFLVEGMVTKAAFLRALGNVNSNSMRRFMSLNRGAGAANEVYRKAYAFFEKKRILDGEEKTVQRLANEDLQGPEGFPRHGVNMYFIEKVLDH
ncbi:hypothetical protein PHYSODRAFT_499398 [Phytophthora sojae]|uniref:DUF7726 domain-containing protein n=1 Tax=Phytophthora sojae (strain P6497) TaxID=1094619 RepID=G4ZD31_PHYSP|nr:hypothetical protein PHYSODRAFT_499398 [Phytophthora sojae]EGZ18979.1 hypothetical protein PHYSODRAFT_499398 [Phytophthora sojae]|eukprot:XP_009528037.1 hypothetical protein PHYSODRAFT_499398 [Phytophthora sojae]